MIHCHDGDDTAKPPGQLHSHGLAAFLVETSLAGVAGVRNRRGCRQMILSVDLRVSSLCAARFGRIKAEMLAAGRPTPDFDLVVSAIAMTHGLTVITADRHFADVPGLASVDWMK